MNVGAKATSVVGSCSDLPKLSVVACVVIFWHGYICCRRMCSGSNAMWCPLGEELLDNGFSAGEERLTKVLLFLDKQELTCVDDFVGPHHS